MVVMKISFIFTGNSRLYQLLLEFIPSPVFRDITLQFKKIIMAFAVLIEFVIINKNIWLAEEPWFENSCTVRLINY